MVWERCYKTQASHESEAGDSSGYFRVFGRFAVDNVCDEVNSVDKVYSYVALCCVEIGFGDFIEAGGR